jgi:heme A synthase
MLLLATLLVAARPHPLFPSRFVVSLTFVTVLLGALTANLGASAACGGFPLCNGQVWTTGGPLALIHWFHRLLAYTLAIVLTVWAVRQPSPASRALLALVVCQVALGAATILSGLPPGLQVAHLALGTAVWGGTVLAAR